MINKKILFTTFLLVFSLLLINNVSAQTVAINSPAANERIRVDNYNVTFTVTDNNDTITNLTLYAISSGGTETLLLSIINTSEAQNTSWSMQIDFIANLSNANDYTLNVTASTTVDAGNGFVTDDTNTGVDIDNVAPTVSFILDRGFTRRSDPTGIEVDCTGSSDATTGIANYTITITKPYEPQVNVSETVTNGKRSFTTTDIDSLGEYQAWCVVDDNTGNVGSTSSQTFQVLSSGDGGAVTATNIIKQQGTQNVTLIVGVVILILFSVGILTAVLIFKGVKNKKR